MVRHIAHAYDRNLVFAKKLVADLSDAQMCQQAHGVVNHPAWSLGHLAVVADWLGTQFGLPSELPAGWATLFKTGGTPGADMAAFPSKGELLRVLEDQHVRVTSAVTSAPPDRFAEPNPSERTRGSFPTLGDLTVFLMTGHEMDHLGQLAAWRRAVGLGPA